MNLELQILTGCVVLNVVLIFLQQFHTDIVMGVKYALSNRAEPKSISAFGGRIDRALDNMKENLLLYAPLALMVAVIDASSNLTQIGAMLFGAGRVIRAVFYLAGIIGVRSLGWFAGIVGIGLMVFSLVTG